MTKRRVIIIGCGYVGSKLAEELVADGHEVIAIRRTIDGLPQGMQAVSADVLKPETLDVLPENIDFAFYTIGAKERTEKAYQAAYVKGLSNILASLQKRSPNLKRFFYVSSTAVYGQTRGEWLDETSDTRPIEFNGKKLLEGEHILLESHLPRTVVRFSGIYGPGRARVIDSIRAGNFRVDLDDKAFTNRIHRDDCSGILRHLMQLEHPRSLYLGVDDEPCKRVVLLKWLANKLGKSLQYSSEFEVKEPENMNKRFKNDRIHIAGYKFRFPTFKEGYISLLS